MKGAFSFLLIAAAIAIVTGYARTAELGGARHLGEVEAVFVELQDGLYAPANAYSSRGARARWVHVRFPDALEDGRVLATALLPTGLNAQAGDLVEVLFGPDDPPTTESTRVTAVIPQASHHAALSAAPIPRP
jgi:hypothetical protein